MKKLILALMLCTCVATPVLADEPPAVYLVDGAPTLAEGSGSGSAVIVVLPPLDTVEGVKARYEELRVKYAAIKDAPDGAPSTLLWAALLAAVLKVGLDGVNVLAKYRWQKSLSFIALGLAVPIALVSKYAVGVGWFEALVYAGSGPGAIVVHELIARFKKTS